MKKVFLLIIAALALSILSAPAANISLSGIFSDGMVLQQQSQAPLWGWADPGTEVTVTPSWAKSKYKAKTSDDGRWEVIVATPAAGGPYSIAVKSGKEKIIVNDVLIGEVWLCSGQSNMQDPVPGFSSQAVEGGLEEVLSAPRFAGKIHIFNVKEDTTNVVQKDVSTRWEAASCTSAAGVSAVAWFFARRLTETLDVPVGIISNAWGGSNIESWMTRESVEGALKGKIPEKRLRKVLNRKNGRFPTKIAALWNGRMAPLAPYRIKGMLWYQGEANLGDRYYNLLQAAMVSHWRETWGDADMPFLFTLIAPYWYNNREKATRAFFVENQMLSLKEIPSCYAASTETLGDEFCIHPPKKKEVSDQFFLLAMEHVYGQSSGIGSGFPTVKSVNFLDGEAVVTFETWGIGLGFAGTPDFRGFEIAGEDRVFHPATAVLNNRNNVKVRSDEVPAPVAVRYGWHNYHTGNLTSSLGIPVPCFRTDSWPEE